MTQELITDPQAQQVAELIDRPIRFGTVTVANPEDVVDRASDIARALSDIIQQRQLFKVIKDKRFVYCEGWTTLGAMLGVVPREIATVEHDTIKGEFIAEVEIVRASDGATVGKASASCGVDERDWSNRSRQARRSMAQTRATSKAFRLSFSWVMQLAGYEPTPLEELDGNLVPDPHPNPAHRADAPKAQPRNERVTPEEVKAQLDEWKTHRAHTDATQDKWQAFVFKVTGRDFPVSKAPVWTREDLNKVAAAIEAEI